MTKPNIPLKQGRNIWRLWRTDRDGASRDGVIQTVGPAVGKMIRPAGIQEGPWEVFRTDGGQGNPRWRVGAARPIELTSLTQYQKNKPAPALKAPKGSRVLADRMKYPGGILPTVNAQTPWWVVVDVWWRKPDTAVPWPGFRVNWLGVRVETVTDADWLLERAVWVPPAKEKAPDPGDETSWERHSEEAGNVIQTGIPIVVVLGLAYVLSQVRR